MSVWINGGLQNKQILEQYCEPHGIDPKSVISIAVNPFINYQIDYMNKDGNYCTILVHEKQAE
jgi:hypothetical protein